MKVKQFDEKTWEILQEIKGKIEFQNRLEIVWKRQQNDQHYFIYEKGEERALADLEKLGAIKTYTEPVAMEKARNIAGFTSAYDFDFKKQQEDMIRMNLLVRAIRPRFDEIYKECEKEYGKKSDFIPAQPNVPPKQIKIKSVRLDEKNYFLEINNGEKIISFKSRKKTNTGDDHEELNEKEREELEGEISKTKMFKVLCALLDFKWEKINGKIRKTNKETSDTVTLKNLTVSSRCKTEAATRKQIKRLNIKFEKEEIPIYIESKNEKAIRIIIDKS